MQHPLAQEPRSHGGDGAIQRAEQGHGFAGAGLDEFQMRLGGGVDDEILAGAVGLEASQVAGVPAHLPGEIVEQRPGSSDGGGQVGTAEALQRVDLEMLAQEFGGGVGLEVVTIEEIHTCR